jgi:hypothetical protein
LGLLYPQKLAGDGKIFYCPSLVSKKSPIGSLNYMPLLTTDSAVNDIGGSGGGNVRGSYIYNPWVVNPDGAGNANHTRLMVKSSNVTKRKVFGMDFIDSASWIPGGGGEVDINGMNFAHSRSKGWNVMFTDNSIEFKKINAKTKAAYALGGFPDQYDIKGICDLSRLAFE